MKSNYENHLSNVLQEVNAISPSYCVAKWKQVTMHLHNGHTHSCHHPSTHLIPLEEIKNNSKALHNTSYKKVQRKLMLEGERPTECEYCWKAEDSGNKFSDRIYKSSDTTWAYEHLQEIATLPWHQDVDPSYVEVSFSSVCNFKCSYCSPNISSQWMEEIERHGAYPTSSKFNNLEWLTQTQQIPIPNNQSNPYVDAFWDWWPEMYLQLKHFRITGGEPLLSKNTFKVLDYIIENPNPNLIVSINTNLNPPVELLDKFIEKVNIIQAGNMVKRFHIFTSAEAQGKQAEYIRFGLDYNLFLQNLEKIICEIPKVACTVMCTYNILSIPTFKNFLVDILHLRRKYNYLALENQRAPVMLDIPYLRYPNHQAAYLAPKTFLFFIEEQIKFMNNNKETGHIDWSTAYMGFHEHEIDKLKRILDIMHFEINNPNKNVNLYRKDFVYFVDEHDKRRGTNFLETFPELKEMYTEWKNM